VRSAPDLTAPHVYSDYRRARKVDPGEETAAHDSTKPGATVSL